MKTRVKSFIEWAVAMVGIAGVAWIALNVLSSKYGWLLAIVAPIMFVAQALKRHIWPLAVNQALLVAINVIGIWRWVL